VTFHVQVSAKISHAVLALCRVPDRHLNASNDVPLDVRAWVEDSAMSDGESPAARYRRRAQECLEIAPTIQDPDSRASLIDMARVWLRLAATYVDATASLFPAPETEQPAVQQQQQIQPKNDDKKE